MSQRRVDWQPGMTVQPSSIVETPHVETRAERMRRKLAQITSDVAHLERTGAGAPAIEFQKHRLDYSIALIDMADADVLTLQQQLIDAIRDHDTKFGLTPEQVLQVAHLALVRHAIGGA